MVELQNIFANYLKDGNDTCKMKMSFRVCDVKVTWMCRGCAWIMVWIRLWDSGMKQFVDSLNRLIRRALVWQTKYLYGNPILNLIWSFLFISVLWKFEWRTLWISALWWTGRINCVRSTEQSVSWILGSYWSWKGVYTVLNLHDANVMQ